ncbi:MAG: peroxiredoxin [Terracidiphilus sp.]
MRMLAIAALTAALILITVSFVRVRAAKQTMPAVGQPAPAFTLPSQDGSPISLASFRGKWVVLYFYPKDMTPGCTIEAHNFQRDLAQFEARNAVILGVSEDTPGSHQKFCTKDGLTFRLLADTHHQVAAAYGSLGSFVGIPIARRNTFLIDPTGRIAEVWTKVNPATASAQVLAAIPVAVSSLSPAAPSPGGELLTARLAR